MSTEGWDTGKTNGLKIEQKIQPVEVECEENLRSSSQQPPDIYHVKCDRL